MAGNPFRYGDVATGDYFTDRVRELAEVQDDVRNGQNLVIISPRRYGKTSLIWEAMRQLRREHILVAYLDLFRAPTKDRLADLLAGVMYKDLDTPVERVAQNVADLFRRLPIQPKVTIGMDGSPSFEFSAGSRSRDIDRTIEELLALPGKIARDRGRRVAVVFDEFQQVIGIDESLPGLMRAVFQEQAEVAHVFLGSKRHLMQEVFTARNQPLYKMAKPVVLPPIGRADFTTFIQARCADSGQEITGDAIDAILDVTGGHPQDTQELCYFTWSLAQGERIPAINTSVVQRGLEQVLDAESARYVMLWDELSALQRLTLMSLAAAPGPVYSEEYRRQHRLGAASSVQKAIGRLLERELIEGMPGDGYRVTDTFLIQWIKQRATP